MSHQLPFEPRHFNSARAAMPGHRPADNPWPWPGPRSLRGMGSSRDCLPLRVERGPGRPFVSVSRTMSATWLLHQLILLSPSAWDPGGELLEVYKWRSPGTNGALGKACFNICSMGFLFIYLFMPCLVQKGFKAACEDT